MEYKINVRNHWWFDSGIVGLYFIGTEVSKDEKFKEIKLSFDANSLSIKGKDEETIRDFLDECYERLTSLYWNVSTKSQKDNQELVLYDRDSDKFFLAPKRQATPVVSNFVKGTSWKAEGIEYKKLDPKLKERTDQFLKQTGKSLWGSKKVLLYTQPVSHPDLSILPKENYKRQYICTVCGKSTSNYSEISQPSFLLFASKSAAQSFHSQGRRPAKICWECELLSKFTMDSINYKKEGTTLSILILNSPNLQHSIDNQRKMGSRSILRGRDDDYFFKNIGFDEDGLIKKAKMSYELLWAYFVDTYNILKSNEVDEEKDDFFQHFLKDIITAPLEIIIIILSEKGQTFITKELIFYNDVSYAFRILDKLINSNVNIKKVFNSLLETDPKGNLLPTRNNILKKVLNKHCILSDLLKLTFNRVLSGQYIDVSNIIRFVTEYFLIIKEDIMNREQIEVAVNLGKQIVTQPYLASGKDKDVLKRIRGDLYALRRTRTVTDFITQLNKFQFRYGISVSKPVLEGILNEVPFEDFKGYCIMGALNNFNYYNSEKKKGELMDES